MQTNVRLDFLFNYLEKEAINIDKSEFEFQVQSHPDYPSILSIVDTLSFFHIENIAIKRELGQTDDLPNTFVTLLKEENKEQELHLIERKNNKFYIDNNITPTPTIELEKIWIGVILLAEKPEIIKTSKTEKNNHYYLIIICFILCLCLCQLYLSNDNWFPTLFLLFPVTGILFSIASLKDLLNVNNKIINNFCNISKNSSCSSVISSSKWKLFEYINFSDLSLTFFSAQFIALFFSIIFNNGLEFLLSQNIIIYFSIPLLLASVYYQKYIEKKWCPICLLIVLIVVLEIITLSFISSSPISIFKQTTYFGLIFFAFLYGWKVLKEVLIHRKKLKEIQLKSMRFEKNYDIFKAKLLTENRIGLFDNSIIIGNKNSKTDITIITNPFCGHCKDVHLMLDRIVDRNTDNVQLNIILRTDFENLDDDSKKLFRTLMLLFFNKGQKEFMKALKFWFVKSDFDEWFKEYNVSYIDDYKRVDDLLLSNFNLTNEIGYTFTPAIFINGYEYPKIYDRKNIEFFINEIIEDEQFN